MESWVDSVTRGNVSQVWHERSNDSPAHKFLRRLIAEVAAGV